MIKDVYINRKSVDDYNKKERQIKKSNHYFIKKKLIELETYFDHIYDNINPSVKLDINQRIAILTDEDYNLIIAGAGSGKTTTMISKIKYLIEKCKVKPEEILAISFAKKNVIELDDKLNKKLNLNVNVKTFHSLGIQIINENSLYKKNIVKDGFSINTVKKYFKEELYKDPEALKDMVEFLTLFHQIGSNMENFNNLDEYFKYANSKRKKSLKGHYEKINNKMLNKMKYNKKTILNEHVKSNEELTIANYLFLNGIKYSYEKRYIYSNIKGLCYYPDFTLYLNDKEIFLEHFGVAENGINDFYTDDELNKYINNIELKEKTHFDCKTVLIKSFSKFNDNEHFLVHLENNLLKLGFKLNKKTDEELFELLIKGENNDYFNNYILKAVEFISKLKLNEYKMNELITILNKVNKRTRTFIKTIIPIYNYYQNTLSLNNSIDFEDMIILAKNIVTQDNFKLSKKYKYLIIDEYQDISKERFELIKEIVNKFNSKVTAVGDDWQAIFGFSGSDVDLFLKFHQYLGYGETLKITETFRNSQQLINVASEFVQKDKNVIKKSLTSKKREYKPVVVYSYGSDSYDRSKAVLAAIYDIYNNNKNSSILLIGRYNFDFDHLLYSKLFKRVGEYIVPIALPNVKLHYCSVHKSKGLEYDFVIIINAIDSMFGFPSKIKDDPIFDIFGSNKNLSYAEERRLFYVALTRTKNKVYITVPNKEPSPFVLELKNNIHVLFKDDVIKKYNVIIDLYKCPICGNKLVKKYLDEIKTNVYECVSDNEICCFKTNNLEHKKNILPCPKCNGYLIYKTKVNNKLLMGCSNYSLDNKGCNYKIYLD